MRLDLLRLGTVRGIDGPAPGYLIRRDDGTVILVDTGVRPGPADDDAPFTASPEEDVSAVLAGLGLRTGDVHLVVCTHLDPDHAGNNDRFPDAEFVVQRRHLAAARSGGIDRIAAGRAVWDRPDAKLRLVDGDTDLFPDVRLIATDGHVPGHQSVLVRLPRTGAVLLAGDAVPLSVAAGPDGRPELPFDLDHDAARASTRRLLALATAERALVVYGHDPFQWPTLRTAPLYFYD